jgi:DNA mismatch endonuclease (patch repair protein)
MDRYTREQRSSAMSKVRSRDTRPELVVRRVLHRHGLRFRLHRRDLPGTPDLVLPKFRTVIQVHGCFWHQHPNCRRAAPPSSNVDFWRQKLERNIARDAEVRAHLEQLGWRVLVIWECETREQPLLLERILRFLRL